MIISGSEEFLSNTFQMIYLNSLFTSENLPDYVWILYFPTAKVLMVFLEKSERPHIVFVSIARDLRPTLLVGSEQENAIKS